MIPAAAGIDEQWYRAHKWKSNSTVIDVLVIMLKFHPLFYLHLYALGVALACVYRHYQGNFPTLFRSGAVIGYAGLALIFTTPSLIPPAHKLSARLGVLAPLQGLVLLGLAIGEDPIAKLFSWWPLQVLAGYSYAVYIFQFICFDLWQEYVDLGFICFLVATAICAQRFANTFLASSPAVFERNAKALAVLTFVALLIWSSLPTNIANLVRSHALFSSTLTYEYT
jgi:peptidoglycan/LPS O-acetylase OafA/YrhL